MGQLHDNQVKFTRLVIELLKWANENPHWEIVLGEVYRPQAMQEIYYTSGRSKTRSSYHTKSLAVDLNLFVDGVYQTETKDYKPLGEYWKSLSPNCVWGGDWGWDGNHFQYGGAEPPKTTSI